MGTQRNALSRRHAGPTGSLPMSYTEFCVEHPPPSSLNSGRRITPSAPSLCTFPCAPPSRHHLDGDLCTVVLQRLVLSDTPVVLHAQYLILHTVRTGAGPWRIDIHRGALHNRRAWPAGGGSMPCHRPRRQQTPLMPNVHHVPRLRCNFCRPQMHVHRHRQPRGAFEGIISQGKLRQGEDFATLGSPKASNASHTP